MRGPTTTSCRTSKHVRWILVVLFGFLTLHLGPCCTAGHPAHHASVERVIAVQLTEPAPEHEDGCGPASGHHRSHGADDSVCRGFRVTSDGSWLAVLALAAIAALATGRKPPGGHDVATAGPPVARAGPHYLIEICVCRT